MTLKELKKHCEDMVSIYANDKEGHFYKEHKLVLSLIEEKERVDRWTNSPNRIPLSR
jgi:hypothetical protein